MFDDDCFGSAPGTRVAGQPQSAGLASAHCLTAAVLFSLPVALPSAAISMATLPRSQLVSPSVQGYRTTSVFDDDCSGSAPGMGSRTAAVSWFGFSTLPDSGCAVTTFCCAALRHQHGNIAKVPACFTIFSGIQDNKCV